MKTKELYSEYEAFGRRGKTTEEEARSKPKNNLEVSRIIYKTPFDGMIGCRSRYSVTPQGNSAVDKIYCDDKNFCYCLIPKKRKAVITDRYKHFADVNIKTATEPPEFLIFENNKYEVINRLTYLEQDKEV